MSGKEEKEEEEEELRGRRRLWRGGRYTLSP